MKPALESIRVVEYGNFISAPYCGKMLADMGAEVIKVEKPGEGDISRKRGPYLKDLPGRERSGLFLYLNTNKLSVTLNLEKNTGRKIFRRLIQDADILIEDTQPGKMDGWGIGYAGLKTINPSLVMTSITPFGQTGPYKNFKGADLIAWQMGGAGYVTPRYAGTTEQEPLKAVQLASFIAGINAGVGSLCALRAQRKNGYGQHVDVSQFESVVFLIAEHIGYPPYENWSPTRASKPWAAPRHFFKCKDGWAYLYVDEPHHWERFVQAMGNPDWGSLERFKDKYSRGKHWEELEPLLAEWVKGKTGEEIFEIGKAKGIPLTAANSVAKVLESRQLQERGYFVDIDHPETGPLTYPGAPYKFSKTPWTIRSSAPLLGQHNKKIYGNRLGFSGEELVELFNTGVI